MCQVRVKRRMMKKTLQEQLESVQTIIAAIEGGAVTYEVPTANGNYREYTYDDLDALYNLEERLRMRLNKDVPIETEISKDDLDAESSLDE